MKGKLRFQVILVYPLILTWTYTGLEKIIRFEASRKAFHNQTFPPELAELLSYSVPPLEIMLALLLAYPATRWWGYLGSLLLFTVFITYVGLIWVGAFPRIPCNCAGIIESLGWGEHFFLNLLMIGISIVGLRSENSKIGTLR
ncbi:MauE/DoxX family redox-associated membrane protein [Algoriphagus namhaensis]